MLPEYVIQPIIVIGALITCYLLACRPVHVRRWGFIIILIVQPFWYMTGIRHRQWGLVLVTTWYVINAIRGLRTHRKRPEGGEK